MCVYVCVCVCVKWLKSKRKYSNFFLKKNFGCCTQIIWRFGSFNRWNNSGRSSFYSGGIWIELFITLLKGYADCLYPWEDYQRVFEEVFGCFDCCLVSLFSTSSARSCQRLASDGWRACPVDGDAGVIARALLQEVHIRMYAPSKSREAASLGFLSVDGRM